MHSLHIDEQSGWRGGEQQAFYLINGLRERGHDVSVVARPGSPFMRRVEDVDGVDTLALPLRGEFDLPSAWRIASYVRRNSVDILHAHTSHAHSIAMMAKLIARRGSVIVSRRVDFAPRRNAGTRFKYRHADRIIAISNTIQNVLNEFDRFDTRIEVVHSGVDPQRVIADPVSREAIGADGADPLIGNVAALVGHKDHRTLIDAMPRVLEQLPNAQLVIAGEGELRQSIKHQIEALGLKDAVHLLGYRDDVPALLNALDLFVLSSEEEGLGTSILDAMAARIPVVATAAGGIPEMVRHEQTGLLSPVHDSESLAENMVRMWTDQTLRENCVAAARAMVDTEFSVDRMIEGNLRVYEAVLA